MKKGQRAYLEVPQGIDIYLDNGAFYFSEQPKGAPIQEYEAFVEAAKPDWKPIPQDFIPLPSTTWQRQLGCMTKTMKVNRDYQHNGYVPVVHVGRFLETYTAQIADDNKLSKKKSIALGGIVPNLLRKPAALPYSDVLSDLRHVREIFTGKSIHVFGVGGTATVHLMSLLNFDSADSSGWRNRAARGIIQLPGSGERLVANLGSWRGRKPSPDEWAKLKKCRCPACRVHGTNGLKASKLHGFCCRATHNLWVLLEEEKWLSKHIEKGTYERNYSRRVDNSTYKPIIDELLETMPGEDT
jgi:queuine/archaeosine tRNA-ribosyltransferase